jgi:cytochrome P450
VPGWAADNESERYYEDTQQFRPGRAREREKPQERLAAEPKPGSGKRKGRNK